MQVAQAPALISAGLMDPLTPTAWQAKLIRSFSPPPCHFAQFDWILAQSRKTHGVNQHHNQLSGSSRYATTTPLPSTDGILDDSFIQRTRLHLRGEAHSVHELVGARCWYPPPVNTCQCRHHAPDTSHTAGGYLTPVSHRSVGGSAGSWSDLGPILRSSITRLSL